MADARMIEKALISPAKSIASTITKSSMPITPLGTMGLRRESATTRMRPRCVATETN